MRRWEGPFRREPSPINPSILAYHFACGQVVVIAVLECVSVAGKAIAQLDTPVSPTPTYLPTYLPTRGTGRSLPGLSSVVLLSLLAHQP